jgi:hypothetical protein
MGDTPDIEVSVPPSGTGCVECQADRGWGLHLRRGAQCGHIGCCACRLGGPAALTPDRPARHSAPGGCPDLGRAITIGALLLERGTSPADRISC